MEFITINSEKTIAELYKEFALVFPYLKIEIEVKSKILTHKLKDISTLKNDFEFFITKHLTVVELNQLFLENIGQNVHIFRKMGSSLVETTFTKQWTLEHQNIKGMEVFS
mgnify:CR=1 FL=1